MKDLSTLEYLYVFRCWSASSETHSCFAVSAIVSKQFRWRANARKGGRTFARRHLGAGDGGRKRHECGGDGEIYKSVTSGHADAGNLAAEPILAVWDGRWNHAAIAAMDVKLLGDLPEPIAPAGIKVCGRPRHWRTPVVLASFAREDPPAI